MANHLILGPYGQKNYSVKKLLNEFVNEIPGLKWKIKNLKKIS